MTEEEKIAFWGDLVEPMTSLVGGLLVRGEYKLADVVKDIVAKAENAALEEREACAKTAMELLFVYIGSYPINEQFADAIRARGQS